MIIRSVSPVLLSAFVLLAVACSNQGRKPQYYSVEETESLKIPEGLDTPVSSSALRIQYPMRPLPSMILDPMPPRISSTTSGIEASSRLSWSAEGMFLMVDDSIESSERRADLVLSRSGMKKITRDDEGVYRFEYYQVFGEGEGGFFSSMAFWRKNKEEDYSGAYQVYLRPDGEKTRVYIKYADGTDCEPDAAEHVLAVLGARLG